MGWNERAAPWLKWEAEFDRMTRQGRVHVPAEVHYFGAVSPG